MLQIGDGNVRGGMVLPAREHGRDMQPYLSSFPLVEDNSIGSTERKRGLGYAVHPGQADGSMLVLAKEWGIGRKAVSRLLEDFSERGLIRVDSNPVTSIIDMVCVKSWMIAGRLIENPAYRQDGQGIRRCADIPFQRATIRDLAPQFGKEEERKRQKKRQRERIACRP